MSDDPGSLIGMPATLALVQVGLVTRSRPFPAREVESVAAD